MKAHLGIAVAALTAIGVVKLARAAAADSTHESDPPPEEAEVALPAAQPPPPPPVSQPAPTPSPRRNTTHLRGGLLVGVLTVAAVAFTLIALDEFPRRELVQAPATYAITIDSTVPVATISDFATPAGPNRIQVRVVVKPDFQFVKEASHISVTVEWPNGAHGVDRTRCKPNTGCGEEPGETPTPIPNNTGPAIVVQGGPSGARSIRGAFLDRQDRFKSVSFSFIGEGRSIAYATNGLETKVRLPSVAISSVFGKVQRSAAALTDSVSIKKSADLVWSGPIQPLEISRVPSEDEDPLGLSPHPPPYAASFPRSVKDYVANALIAGTDTHAESQDTSATFFAGAFLGLAGAALIATLQELLKLTIRRRLLLATARRLRISAESETPRSHHGCPQCTTVADTPAPRNH